MVGRAAAVLSPAGTPSGRHHAARAAVAAVLVGLLAAYMAGHEHLWHASLGWDVAFLGAVLMPAAFLLPALGLPLRRLPFGPLAGVAVVLAGGAVLAEAWDAAVPGALLKLGAVAAVGFLFASLFESVVWVAGIAVVVPWIDAWSVWRGPTKHLVTQRRELFSTFSVPFPIPGEHAAAALGLPDVLFFAVFLSAAARWGLRTHLTWLGMVASLGLTMALAAYTSIFGGAGLPALPLLAVGFLLPNLDLLMKRLLRSPSPR